MQVPFDISSEKEKTYNYVVYVRQSGNIIHSHGVCILPGGYSPSEDEISATAIEYAVKNTGREPSDLRTLRLEQNIKPKKGIRYRVDIHQGNLVEELIE